jgi:UDP-N-acetylglucosamine 4,6-dehydratase
LLKDKTILITGGSGSFGSAFIKYVLTNDFAKKLIVFSRDWLKQLNLREKLSVLEKEIYLGNTEKVRYFIGDIRDKDRLKRALYGVDIVIHSAAIKDLLSCQYNPAECMKTNVIGTQNVIDACIDTGVEKALLISTDKAVYPINTYGQSKALAESLFIQGNNYSPNGTKFSVCRWGNIVGSNGSVVPVWKKMIESGVTTVPLTSDQMSRYWFKMDDALRFVLQSINKMQGGEIFLPDKMPSIWIKDLCTAMSVDYEIVGIRDGEKLHESIDEKHSSDKNNWFLTIDEIKESIQNL